jgi:signal transduction histidine kinase
MQALLPTAFIILLVVVVGNYGLGLIVRNIALQRNIALVKLAAESVNQELIGNLKPLETVADALAEHQGDLDAQNAILTDWKEFLRSFEGGVTLLDIQGNAIASTPSSPDRIGRNYAFRPYFQQAKKTGSPVFSTVLIEVPTGKQAVVIAVPLFKSGQPTSVLIGVLFLQQSTWFQNIQMLQTYTQSQAYIVDSDANIIYHPNPGRIGQSLRSDSVLSGLFSKGQAEGILYNPTDGREQQVVTFAPLGTVTSWGIVMEEPWHALIAPSEPYIWFSLFLLVVGLLFSTLMLWGNLSRLGRPILALMGEANRISSGAPFEPLLEQGPSEMRLLTKTFNEMVLRLNEQQQAMRHYAQQVVRSQEEERQRISRDLHDETVQDLVGLGQRLELCKSALARDPGIVRSRLEELQALVVRAVADVRRMSNDLRPSILEDLGLVVAVTKLAKVLEEDIPTIRVEVVVKGYEKRLPPELELAAYRVIQESLTNIRKHARDVTLVRVQIQYEPKRMNAIVEDNGKGFEVVSLEEQMKREHLGLAGMAERARLFNGTLDINSTPGKGTRITLSMPI